MSTAPPRLSTATPIIVARRPSRLAKTSRRPLMAVSIRPQNIGEGDGTATVVEWSSEFRPKGASEGDAITVIQDIYQSGLDSLKKLMGG